MPDAALGRARLVAQGLVTRPHESPAEAVRALGAMQGQDLPGVLASAALRTQRCNVTDVVADLDSGALVRGYPMRGTVFLMAAEDVAWVSELCNAAALRAARKRRAQLEITDDIVEKAREVAHRELATEPRGLPRAELFSRWEAEGIPAGQGRGYHQLAHLIGEGDLVYGPWNGTDQNVVVAAGWLPAGATLEGRFNGERVPAVAEFLRRYLTSHGPSTLRDFAWWTKLPLKEIRTAGELIGDEFEVGSGGAEPALQRPGLSGEVTELGAQPRRPILLPGFDEFILGYQDRLFAMTPQEHQALVPGNNGVFGRSVVVDGTVRGIWRRAGRPGRRTLEVTEFSPLPKTTTTALQRRFAEFPFAGE